MNNVLTMARKLAKLDPEERRLASQVANEIAGDGRKRKRRVKRTPTVARASKQDEATKAPGTWHWPERI